MIESLRRTRPSAIGRISLATLLALSAVSAAALDPDRPIGQYLVDFWKESSGLPQNYILSLVQTRDGYLWVGTLSGLARFDGVRFTVFDDTKPGQLGDSEVWGLASGEDSSLWIATYGGGLSHLKDGVFTTLSTKDGLPSDQLSTVTVAPGGAVWVGSAMGLARIEGGRVVRFTTSDGLPSDNILSLHSDAGGVVWVGTDRGLAAVSEGRVVNHARAHPGDLDTPIQGITGSLKGGIWVACRGRGLRRLAEGSVQRFAAAEGLKVVSANAVFLDDRGTLWIGTTEGLWRYRDGRFESCSFQSPDPVHQRTLQSSAGSSIFALQGDREGSVWFGTRLDGLGRVRNPLVVNLTGANALGKEIDARVLHEGPTGELWFGTARDLRRVDGDAVTVYPLPAGVTGEGLAHDSDGSLIVGSGSGLSRFRNGRLEPLPLVGAPNPNVSLLFTDAKGALWIGTRSDGAYRLTDGALVPFGPEQGLLGSQVRGMAEDSRGGLWIATRNGGVSRLRDGKIDHFGLDQGLPSPAAQAVHVDRADSAWVCTRLGLARIKDDRIATVTAANGLPGNYFYQMAEDDEGYFWLTFARGIARVSRRDLDAVADGTSRVVTPRLLGMESGMGSTMMTVAHQPTVWKAKDGRMWFTTARGVTVADPRALSVSPLPPVAHIEELRAGGQPLALGPAPKVPPGQGDVEIQYTGLSFAGPERLRFRYRLDGFEEAWQDAGTRRIAYYTKVPPGAYRFRVVATTPEGVASEREAELRFSIAPRWNETVWWRSLLALLAGGAMFGVYRLRVAALERRSQELAAKVEMAERLAATRQDREVLIATLERRNAELERFTYSVSHDLRTPLVTVRGFVGLLEQDLAAGATDKVEQDLARMRSATDTMETLLRKLLNLSKVGLVAMPTERVALDEVAQGALGLFTEVLRDTGVRVVLHPGLPVVMGDRSRLLEVFQNLIENAVKFRRKDGEAIVEVGSRPGAGGPVVYVRDNGVGIDSRYLERIFALFERLDPSVEGTGVGLALVKRILEEHGGRVWAESDGVGCGATFCFTLPPMVG